MDDLLTPDDFDEEFVSAPADSSPYAQVEAPRPTRTIRWFEKPVFPLKPLFNRTPGHFDFLWTIFRVWNVDYASIGLELEISKYTAGAILTLGYIRFSAAIPVWALW